MRLVTYIPNLTLRLKVWEELKHDPGVEVKSLIDEADLEEADYLIADLDEPKVQGLLKKYPQKMLCFCSKDDLMMKSKQLGCQHVYSRRLFFLKLPELLNSLK